MDGKWAWIGADLARVIHGEQLAEHGGPPGVRNDSGLESAMARAPNLAASGTPDVAELAAAYAYGIARNHPFVDGNKRSAAVISETFLMLNGHALTAGDAEVVVAIQQLAAGELTEAELVAWFREFVREA